LGTNIVEKHTFSGYVLFDVQFECDVCNPCPGDIIFAKVKNMNKFGVLCVSGFIDEDMHMASIIEIVIPKCSTTICKNKDLVNQVKIDDMVEIELLGKKMKTSDTKISMVGRIVKKVTNVNVTTNGYKMGLIMRQDGLDDDNVDNESTGSGSYNEEEYLLDEDDEEDEDKDQMVKGRKKGLSKHFTGGGEQEDGDEGEGDEGEGDEGDEEEEVPREDPEEEDDDDDEDDVDDGEGDGDGEDDGEDDDNPLR
jgi:DNA-directed RNA polymerase subunit E'/Rpb7